MIGTDDEQHYWDCHDAATEIERLRAERNYWIRQTMAFAEHSDNMRLSLLEPCGAILRGSEK
jgi:hypothetical protein